LKNVLNSKEKRLVIDAVFVKELAKQAGADLCGIAPIQRFDGAPEGFHPKNIFPDCQSVIVLARRSLASALESESVVPYTKFNEVVTRLIDELIFHYCLVLEDHGVRAVPIPADDPYIHWNPDTMEGRGILSLRHAGMLAGLGVLGRNTLLKNLEWGNMIRLGAVLVDRLLEGDPLAREPQCPPNCSICLQACPAGALNGLSVDQLKCRSNTYTVNERGFHLIQCHACRKMCPDHLGKRNQKKSG
jgi:epoxyqueuosine reductase